MELSRRELGFVRRALGLVSGGLFGHPEARRRPRKGPGADSSVVSCSVTGRSISSQDSPPSVDRSKVVPSKPKTVRSAV